MSGVHDRPRELTIVSRRRRAGRRAGRGARFRPGPRPGRRGAGVRAVLYDQGAKASASACRSAARSSRRTAGGCGRARTSLTGRSSGSRCPSRGGAPHERTIRPVVFVVDDDPSMRSALDTLLRSVGLDVRVFSSPQEFMRAERPDAPGCLVLDVRLPGMSGLAFQEELAKGRHRSPGHLHHRPRRRSDDRARDEGRRGRVPHQAVRRPGAARCDPRGDRARPAKAPGRRRSSPS